MACCGFAARVFGLWHGELHGGQFRIKLLDPTALYLRDFGRTRVDEAKQRQDIENLCLRVRFPNQDGDECLEALCVAAETGTIDFGFWIGGNYSQNEGSQSGCNRTFR
jgi:hypothetical protein